MPSIFKFKYAEHIQAGHFNVYPKPWMGGKLIWFWQRGDDPEAVGIGGFDTQDKAEEAAMEWYQSTQKLKDVGLNPDV